MNSTKTAKTWLILFALFLLAVAARIVPGTRTIDDAFITFRYSRNIVEGQGFVYNPGVRTLGTTTPLFTLIMAGIGAIDGRGEYPGYALGVSAVADGLTAALLYGLARWLISSDLIATLPGVLWAISPMSVTFAVGGMETSVNILWMVAATWLYATAEGRCRDYAIGVCAALGVLTRVDAALWIAPLFAFQLIDTWQATRGEPILKRLPLRTWIVCALVLLPWMIFSSAYFGAAVPNSVTAKRFAYLIHPGAAAAQLVQTYANLFFQFDTFGAPGAMIGGVLILTCNLFALAYAVRRCPRVLPFLIYPWLYFATFAALNPQMFRWYMVPPLPALMFGTIVGVWALLRPMTETRAPALAPLIGGLVGVVCIVTSLSGWTLMPDHGGQRPAPKMAWHEIELAYQRMGEYLRDDLGVTPATRVASGDIGAIGYFSRATIVDTVGLVTPELTRYYPVDAALIVPGMNYAIPPQLIYDTQPDYLVTMEGFVRQGLAREARFQSEYALIESYPFEVYGSAMQLYARR